MQDDSRISCKLRMALDAIGRALDQEPFGEADAVAARYAVKQIARATVALVEAGDAIAERWPESARSALDEWADEFDRIERKVKP